MKFFIFTITVAILTFVSPTASLGQSLAEARKLYNNGKYEEAKPVFKKLADASPANANYNTWCGVCFLKTGEPQEALKYLRAAVKRNSTEGQLYLGEVLNKLYLFEEAEETLEAYKTTLSKQRKSTAKADSLLEISRNGLSMVRGVEDVTIVDSIVVDKNSFLNYYHLSADAGMLSTVSNMFKKASGYATTYENELRNKVLYGEMKEDSTYSIASISRISDDWTKPEYPLSKFKKLGNMNFPFVTSDGQTIYFAADGEESIGGYDIFVTRYNQDDGTCYEPENIGMPFNSPYNDYMYAVDEYNNLGWFATDRLQPEGKVCVYVFIPNETKHVYNYEETDKEKMARLAQLSSIKETWTDQNKVNSALSILKNIKTTSDNQTSTTYDFIFVIDDEHAYHKLNDFRSQQAKDLFINYQQSGKKHAEILKKLEDLRKQYSTSGSGQKSSIKEIITELEHNENELYNQNNSLKKEVRKIEKQTLNKR